MTKIGMLYICTGKYTVFWPEFYRSFEEKFLPGCEKEYFVFTDAPAIEYEDAPRVHRIYQEAYPWPYSTLKRFSPSRKSTTLPFSFLKSSWNGFSPFSARRGS